MRNGDCVELNGKTIEEDAKEFRIVGHAQLFHIQLLKQSIPPSPLSFLPSPYCFDHCFCLLEEVDLGVIRSYN